MLQRNVYGEEIADLEKVGKRCRICGEWKNLIEFGINHYTKNNLPKGRGSCRSCVKSKKQFRTLPKAVIEIWKSSKPKMGEIFNCPCCKNDRVVNHKRAVVLDHCHTTSKVLGWICGSCNVSMGVANDDPTYLIKWITWKLQAVNPMERKKIIDELKKELDKCLEICYNTLYNDE